MGPALESLSARDIIGPDEFAANGYPHDAWRTLRRESPLHWFDLEGGPPGFWAVTRRADIVWLSKQPERFLNEPRLAVIPDSPGRGRENKLLHHLLTMDPPEHRRFRNVSSSWFTPRAVARRRPEIEKITRDVLENLRGRDEVDFVRDFTAPLTLSVLADILGVPRADWERMFLWTNQIAGATDHEYQLVEGDTGSSMEKARDQMFEYFLEMVADRRRHPRGDMVSVLANAEVDGRRMAEFDLLSYIVLLVSAGNETTRNAASGGLMALIDNPGELQKLRSDLGLVSTAVEEIVRWTSPVIQFCRTPIEDFELHGQSVKAGQSLCLIYPSANRDENVFAEPDEFRVDRSPNPHIGFGIGEHFCLGANLARLELRVALEQLVPRLKHVEVIAPVERMRSSLLGGVKRLPIRYELVAA